jgi:voltage-gated potassium channel Kch
MVERRENPQEPAVRRQRRTDRIWAWVQGLSTTVVVIALYFVVPLRPEDLTDGQPAFRWPGLVIGFTVMGFLVRLQVKRALRPGRLLIEQLSVLLTLVAVVAAGFAAFYYRGAEQFVGIETRMDALYFSMTTLTSVGYGDVVPTGQAARALVTAQMVFDLIIVTSAISTIVGALRPGRESGPDR